MLLNILINCFLLNMIRAINYQLLNYSKSLGDIIHVYYNDYIIREYGSTPYVGMALVAYWLKCN